MTPLDRILWFIEEGGAFMYPILLVGVLANLLLVHYRAWRGRRSTAPLRRRMTIAVLGAFGCISLALCGYLVNVVILAGAIADPSVALVFKALMEAFNLAYLGFGLALFPSIVMLRALLFELAD